MQTDHTLNGGYIQLNAAAEATSSWAWCTLLSILLLLCSTNHSCFTLSTPTQSYLWLWVNSVCCHLDPATCMLQHVVFVTARNCVRALELHTWGIRLDCKLFRTLMFVGIPFSSSQFVSCVLGMPQSCIFLQVVHSVFYSSECSSLNLILMLTSWEVQPVSWTNF